MDLRFPVLWREVFRTFYVHLALVVSFSIVAITLARVITHGPEEAFRSMTLFGVIIGIPVAACVIGVFSLGIALLFRTMAIRITSESISGRNFFGLTRSIPLTEITGVSLFVYKGVHSYVVSSTRNGQIHILKQTENLTEILRLLAIYTPNAIAAEQTRPANGAPRRG